MILFLPPSLLATVPTKVPKECGERPCSSLFNQEEIEGRRLFSAEDELDEGDEGSVCPELWTPVCFSALCRCGEKQGVGGTSPPVRATLTRLRLCPCSWGLSLKSFSIVGEDEVGYSRLRFLLLFVVVVVVVQEEDGESLIAFLHVVQCSGTVPEFDTPTAASSWSTRSRRS